MDAVADRLNASTEQLARMLERERHFSANASHQLRTTLTALRIPLEELTLAEDRTEVRELTDLVIHQADRLQATIEELLALAQGRVEPSPDYDAAAVIADRATAWRPVLARQGRLVEAPSTGPVPASGSPATLRQVLDVLIDNARLHGAGTVRIDIEVRAGSAVVSVGDEGPGIAEGREQRIFERGTSFGGGRGVGLAVGARPAGPRRRAAGAGPVAPAGVRRLPRPRGDDRTLVGAGSGLGPHLTGRLRTVAPCDAPAVPACSPPAPPCCC